MSVCICFVCRCFLPAATAAYLFAGLPWLTMDAGQRNHAEPHLHTHELLLLVHVCVVVMCLTNDCRRVREMQKRRAVLHGHRCQRRCSFRLLLDSATSMYTYDQHACKDHSKSAYPHSAYIIVLDGVFFRVCLLELASLQTLRTTSPPHQTRLVDGQATLLARTDPTPPPLTPTYKYSKIYVCHQGAWRMRRAWPASACRTRSRRWRWQLARRWVRMPPWPSSRN